MKTKIETRKSTVLKWITGKFGSIAMLAAAGGLDTTQPGVQALLNDIVKSRDPVELRIGWRTHVLCISILHHKARTTKTNVDALNSYVSDIPASDLIEDDGAQDRLGGEE